MSENDLPDGIKPGYTEEELSKLFNGLDLEPSARVFKNKRGTLVTKRIVRLTPELCWEYLKLNQLKQERPLSDLWVNFLRNAIIEGAFRPELVTLARVSIGDLTLRINGQNTAAAYLAAQRWFEAHAEYAQTNELQLEWPEVNECLYTAEKAQMAEVRRLYSTFDQGKPRSMTQIFRILFADSKMSKSMSERVGNGLMRGLKMYRFGSRQTGNRHKRPVEEALETLQSRAWFTICRDIGKIYAEYGKDLNDKILNQPVMAAILATRKASPDYARDFWISAISRLGIQFGNDDPRMRAYDLISGQKTGRAKNNKKVKVIDNAKLIYHELLWYFNAHVQGELVSKRPTELQLQKEPVILAKPEVKPAKATRKKLKK